jgi:hypothetical protein
VRNARPVLRSEMFGLRNRIRLEINSLRHRRKSVSRNRCVGMLSVHSVWTDTATKGTAYRVVRTSRLDVSD